MRLFDVKLYEPKAAPGPGSKEVRITWEEMETVRGLTETQKIVLASCLDRNNVRYLVKEVTAELLLPGLEEKHINFFQERYDKLKARYDRLPIPSKEGPVIRDQLDFLEKVLEALRAKEEP